MCHLRHLQHTYLLLQDQDTYAQACSRYVLLFPANHPLTIHPFKICTILSFYHQVIHLSPPHPLRHVIV